MPCTPRGPEHRRTWRPELAYVVGLLATDGNLSPDGRHILVVSRDLQLLQTVAEILKLTNRIGTKLGGYTRQPVYQLTFGDHLFYEWLVSIGLDPRKTYTMGSLNIPDDLFGDFLRGHLDGDGSISAYVDRSNTHLSPSYVYQRLFLRFISVSGAHMEWLQTSIHRLSGRRGHLNVLRRRAQQTAPLHVLKFGKRDSIALLRWMYYAPDVPCLPRKRAVAETFLKGDPGEFRHPKSTQP